MIVLLLQSSTRLPIKNEAGRLLPSLLEEKTSGVEPSSENEDEDHNDDDEGGDDDMEDMEDSQPTAKANVKKQGKIKQDRKQAKGKGKEKEKEDNFDSDEEQLEVDEELAPVFASAASEGVGGTGLSDAQLQRKMAQRVTFLFIRSQ